MDMHTEELQDHAAKTQDMLVDAVENAEVTEIKRAVFCALTCLRAATIKEFETIARFETQAIDAYNDAHQEIPQEDRWCACCGAAPSSHQSNRTENGGSATNKCHRFNFLIEWRTFLS